MANIKNILNIKVDNQYVFDGYTHIHPNPKPNDYRPTTPAGAILRRTVDEISTCHSRATGLRSVTSPSAEFRRLSAHWYTFGCTSLILARRTIPGTHNRCLMTRFHVHLCFTPWTTGQARRRRAGVIFNRMPTVIDRLWSDWKRNRAPKTHTTQLTAPGMNEWSPPPPFPHRTLLTYRSSRRSSRRRHRRHRSRSKTVFALYSCASERSSRTCRPNLDMGQRAAYSIGSRAKTKSVRDHHESPVILLITSYTARVPEQVDNDRLPPPKDGCTSSYIYDLSLVPRQCIYLIILVYIWCQI